MSVQQRVCVRAKVWILQRIWKERERERSREAEKECGRKGLIYCELERVRKRLRMSVNVRVYKCEWIFV